MSSQASHSAEALVEPLTRREREILALLAQGYSGPEIAEQLTLAVSSVKWHIQHLYGKLGVNSKRQAVTRAKELGLLGTSLPTAPPESPPASAAQPGPKHNLPLQITRFFGREAEMARLKERLAEYRLVTLTGSGGVGKSRLSLRVAEETFDNFPDGVWFIELASLNNGELVTQQVASSLGLSSTSDRAILEMLKFFLRDRKGLLVLDNCEHLLKTCAWLVDGLLQACPRLRILASSREPFRIAGEAVFVVPALSFPDPHHLPAIERVDEYTALSLFIDRARAVAPDYQITPQDAPYLARICQRLDGIPPALELAAARMNLLNAEELAGRLDDVFRLVTGGNRTALPQHQTLRAAMDWSYKLLDEDERLLLQRLSVFAGGCTLEAVEAVCSGEGLESRQVLDLLASLVGKSMVNAGRRPGEETRYHLLEMVRQYGREKLEQAGLGESERLNRRHWEYFLQFAETHGPQFWYKERPTWDKRFRANYDNLRQALDWAYNRSSDVEAGLRLTVALQPFWSNRPWGESSKWMQKGVAVSQGGASISPALNATFLAWAVSVVAGGEIGRFAFAQQSLHLSRGLGPEGKETLCWSLWVMAMALPDCVSFHILVPEAWDQAQALLGVCHFGGEFSLSPPWSPTTRRPAFGWGTA